MIDTTRTYRPEEVAAALGVSGKLVRGFLRSTFTRPIEAKGTTWVLTGDQAKIAFDHFIARRSPVEVDARLALADALAEIDWDDEGEVIAE